MGEDRSTRGKDGKFTGTRAGKNHVPTPARHLALVPDLNSKTVTAAPQTAATGRIHASGMTSSAFSNTRAETFLMPKPGSVVQVNLGDGDIKAVVITEHVSDMNGVKDVDGWRGHVLGAPHQKLSGFEDQIEKVHCPAPTAAQSPSADGRPQAGQILTYATFGGARRRIYITGTYEDVKNGAPGFEGFLVDNPDEQVWGYDDQIVR